MQFSLCASAAITFESPTPTDASTISTTNFTVNGSFSDGRSYAFFNINNTLLGWWNFDNSTSTVATDISGNGYHFNILRAFRNTTSTAFGNTSIEFNQTDSVLYTSTGAINARLVSSQELTFSYWFFTNNSNNVLYRGPGCVSSTLGVQGFFVFNTSSTFYPTGNSSLRLTMGNGTNANYIESNRFHTKANQWYHVAMTYKRGLISYYIDGRLINSVTQLPNTNISDCGFGEFDLGGTPFSGPGAKYDDLLVFSRALKDDEIGYLYNVTGSTSKSFATSVFGLRTGNITVQAKSMNVTGVIQGSSLIGINTTRTGPYFLRVNYTFENITNLTTLSAYIDDGFYPTSSIGNMSRYNGSAYYRVNGGSWTLFNSSTYTPFNASALSGQFGDSITSAGAAYRWPQMIDPWANMYSIYTNIARGIGGYTCSQITPNIIANATNGTTIFLQCGTNDVGSGLSTELVKVNYTHIFSQLRAKNNKVYLINMIPREGQFTSNITSINTFLRNYYLNNNSDRLILGLADVYNTSLTNSTGGANLSIVPDNIHPNDLGATIYADTVFRQAYHYKYHDGFYTDFVPTPGVENATYDLLWNISTPTGESTTHQFTNALFLTGSYNVTPVITLNSPANASTVNDASVVFNASVSTNYSLVNFTFYLWNATGELLNITNTSLSANTSALTVALPYTGTFEWNYEAYDSFGNRGFASANFTVTYTPASSSDTDDGSSTSTSRGGASGFAPVIPSPAQNTSAAEGSGSSSGSSGTITIPEIPEERSSVSAFFSDVGKAFSRAGTFASTHPLSVIVGAVAMALVIVALVFGIRRYIHQSRLHHLMHSR